MSGFREKKKQRRQQRIFSTAIQLFQEKGFHATHMSDISKRAELAVGTLYNYYPSKNDLVAEIMEQKWHEMLDRNRRSNIRILLAGNDAVAVLQGILRPFIDEILLIPKEGWYEFFMAVFGSQKLINRGFNMDMEAVDQFKAILRILQKRNLIRKDIDPQRAAYSLYSLVAFQILGYLFFPEMKGEELQEEIEHQVRLLVEGLGGGRSTAHTARIGG